MNLPTQDPSPEPTRRDLFIPNPDVNALPPQAPIDGAPDESATANVTVDAQSTAVHPGGALPEPAELLLAQLQEERGGENRRFRILLMLATLAHLALFFVVFPEMTREPEYVGTPGKVYVMQQTRFKKPPPRAEKQEQKVPKKKAKKIPIPDPTPDDPEPIEIEPVDVPELELESVEDVVFGIPDGPDPGTGKTYGAPFQGDAFQVGDGIAKPIAIHKPQPRYTEEARQARIQGVVILSCVVTEKGEVAKLKVIKGLPLGLDESALETVATWKFKPAKDLEGRPVPVYFHITVSFWLQ